MSNVAYPVGSVHRCRDLLEELPREDCGATLTTWLRAAKTLFTTFILNAIGWLFCGNCADEQKLS